MPSRPLICLSLNEAIRGRVPYKRSVAVRPLYFVTPLTLPESRSRGDLERFWPRLKRPGGFSLFHQAPGALLEQTGG